jgi:transcriptional regulator with XRE-family HTH domain
MNEADIDRFYQDVDALGLRFPNKEIAARTGLTKGTVSEYLNKKQPPSESFIKAFYKQFEKDLENVRMTTYSSIPSFQTKGSESEKDRIIKSQEQHIRDLQQQLEFLKSLLQEKVHKR